MLSWLKVAAALLAVTSIKTLPFSYFVQFYAIVIRAVYLGRISYYRNGKRNSLGFTQPEDVFGWVPFQSYVSPLEIDMYLHKSNLTYFTDLDLARTKLVVTVMQRMFIRYRDNENGDFKRKGPKNYPFVPVGSIKGAFKRELTLFTPYTIESRFIGWDDYKWVYVLSKFSTKGKGSTEKVMAIFVTKYVFKRNGRITIRPREILEQNEFFNEEVYEQGIANGKLAWTDDWDVLAKLADVKEI